MADIRTKKQKLEAMANQTTSPQEAEIAKRMLKDLEDKIDLIAIDIFFDGNKIIYHWKDQFGKSHSFRPVMQLSTSTVLRLDGEIPTNLKEFTLKDKIRY